MPTRAEPVIQTNGLTRHYGSVRAVEDLNLSVPAGSVFGFLGPNGAGKTTTIRLLLGIVDATRGAARVLGFDVATEGGEMRRRCGVLLEHSGLYERMSALDNLQFHRRAHGMSAADSDERIQALLKRFDLWERRHEPAGRFSKGMKQKLAVARAMLPRPKLVFLDEPTNGLDPESSLDLRDHVSELARNEGVTFFLTTHQLAEVERMCTHVGVMRKGRLRAAGDLASIRALGGSRRVEFVGSGFSEAAIDELEHRSEVRQVQRHDSSLTVLLHDNAPVAPLTTLLVQRGAALEAVRPIIPTLESGYFALMNDEQ